MFEVTFLGTGGSAPAAERGQPALLVGCGGRRVLIDCGEGTQRQLLRSGAGLRRLERILLTHAHLDHVLGLGGLIASLGLLGLDRRLVIGGSAETVAFVERYLGALWPRRAPLPLHFLPLDAGSLIEEQAFRLRCIAVAHRGTQSLGYRFETPPRRHLRAERLAMLGVPEGPERAALARGEDITLASGRAIAAEQVLGPPEPGTSLVVIGDAEETASLAGPVAGADALVIEATFLDRDADVARAYGHLTAGEAARLAAAAGIGALHLTHLSGRYGPEEIAAEARRYFPAVRVAADFDRVTVAPAAKGPGISRPGAAPFPAG
jgi:ribonuclease Z